MKIIYENNEVRKIEDDNTDLADMRFFISAEDRKLYLAKFNNQIVPLMETSDLHSRYKIFKLANISNNFVATEVSIICISSDFSDIDISKSIPIETENKKYIAENSALFNSVVTQNIQNMYDKIIELTKLNIKIHEEMRDADE